jgi:hypothetical protein
MASRNSDAQKRIPGDAMTTETKDVTEIVPEDFAVSPVWEFTNEDTAETDTMVRPVLDLPVVNLDFRIVGTRVCLANGQVFWAMLDGIDPESAFRTRHFLSIALYRGRWFHLARYHDAGLEQFGPPALARFLGLSVEDIFPIAYDIRTLCIGDSNALHGTIESDPVEKLRDDELIRMAVPKRDQ